MILLLLDAFCMWFGSSQTNARSQAHVLYINEPQSIWFCHKEANCSINNSQQLSSVILIDQFD